MLTWNNGSPQSSVNFTTTSHSAGDIYDIALQVSSAVTSTGYYPWKVDITFNFTGGDTITRSVTGNLGVVVNGSGATDGQGWSISGVDSLVSVSGGVVWVYGTGGSRYFASLGSGAFLSPPNDFGVLTQSQIDSTYTYTAKNQTQWKFDSGGALTKIVNADSLTRTYAYASGLASTITEPSGAVTTFGYDGSNKLATVTEPGNRVVTVSVNGSGDTSSVTMPDGNQWTFTYDASHRVTNLQYGPLNATFAYDSGNGTLATVSLDSGSANLAVSPAIEQGLTTTPAKNASQVPGVLTDGRSLATSYTLDTAGRPTQIQTPDGATQSWGRDFAGQPTTTTDARGNVTTNLFNYGADKGDLLKVTFADGTTEAFSYDATFHRPTQITDQLGNITTLTYDVTTGDLLTIKNPLSQVMTFPWSTGLKQTVTNALGKTTSLQYDATRRLQVTVDADNFRTTLGYDAAGNISRVKDALNNVTSFAFDAMRRQTSVRYPGGATATFAYNALGEATDETDQLGRRTTMAYDGHGWLTSTTQGAGTGLTHVESEYYGAVGTTTGTLDARGNLTQFLVDADSRATVTIDAGNNRTTQLLDSAGRVTGVQDANAHLTQFLFDALNCATVTVDGRGDRVTQLFDAAGNVSGTLDGRGNVTQFLLDADNRVSVTIDAASERVTTLFDAASNATVTIDANNNRAPILFDALNRATVTVDANNYRTTQLLDAAGNIGTEGSIHIHETHPNFSICDRNGWHSPDTTYWPSLHGVHFLSAGRLDAKRGRGNGQEGAAIFP